MKLKVASKDKVTNGQKHNGHRYCTLASARTVALDSLLLAVSVMPGTFLQCCHFGCTLGKNALRPTRKI